MTSFLRRCFRHNNHLNEFLEINPHTKRYLKTIAINQQNSEINIKYNQLFINGSHVDSISGSTIPTIDPRNNSIICEVSSAQPKDVDIAINAARKSFDSGIWSSKSGFYRSEILYNWAKLIEINIEYIALLETLDQGGKTYNDNIIEIQGLCDFIYYFSGICNKIQGKTLPNNDTFNNKYFSYTLREPKGVIATITPWNYPLMMFIWCITPALACGNSVVSKVSEITPLSALYVSQLLTEAGLPNGCLNILNGYGNITGEYLIKHSDINSIHFTGNNETGKHIMYSASDNLTPVCLELGGKNVAIVFKDADIDNAISYLLTTVFYNNGQTCDSSAKIYVHENVYDEFVEKIVNETRKRKIGDPFDNDVDQGPITTPNQYNKILSYIESGLNEGGEILYGGNKLCHINQNGYYINNTIFINVNDNMKIAKEEIFGAVMCIIKFNDNDNISSIANNTPYGLSSIIFTQDIDTINEMSRSLKTGSVWVNCYGINDPSIPFGGFKNSGFGKSNSEYCLDNYTQIKAVTTKLTNDGGWY